MASSTSISIIIPTLNEASVLDRTLRCLLRQEKPFETIVVDGGSRDDTTARAQSWGATVYEAPTGRASQMNWGAERASGDVFLFLHADTLLPPEGLSTIREALEEPGTTSGTFRLQFDHPTPLLRFYGWCTRWPWIRLCFGDRGQFAHRSAFEAVGGFPDWPVFEDLEFAARLSEYGGFRFLDTAVMTSSRRFHRHGPVRQQLLNLYLWTHYMLGTDPERVAHLYHSHAPPSSSRTDPPR